MSKLEVQGEDHKLHGLWLWDYAYCLDDDAFPVSVKADVTARTKLELSSFLPDWWVYSEANQLQYSWKALIDLAVNILRCDATRIFVHGLYLDHDVSYTAQDIAVSDLPARGCSGAKRVNATTEIVNWDRFTHPERGALTTPVDYFYLHGKDASCCVEGTWLDWCMFACNILANENTKLCCPELYAPGLANNNY